MGKRFNVLSVIIMTIEKKRGPVCVCVREREIGRERERRGETEERGPMTGRGRKEEN